MTFEDWFGTGHRLDDHDKQVAELMRMAWHMADKSARNECASICDRLHAETLTGEGMAKECADEIRKTIK